MRSREIAVQLDRDGYFGTLVVGKNPLVETATWIPVTQNLRFLIPIYPGAVGENITLSGVDWDTCVRTRDRSRSTHAYPQRPVPAL